MSVSTASQSPAVRGNAHSSHEVIIVEPVEESLTIAPPARVLHRSTRSRAKRVIDIVGSVVGMMITAVLLVPIALAIRFDSAGPVFFRQARCGLGGEPFGMWKFRTMQVSADSGDGGALDLTPGYEHKSADDERVTRVGSFLRATSLDELPQFLNVLRGQMSLVGTRPPTTEEAAVYLEHHWQRLTVRPGMTGEWQVRGRSDISDFERVVELDLYYQERWSIAYDVRLMLITVWRVALRRGAV